jgi:hypothetical protein
MFKGRSGVAAGKYKVTITPPEPAAAGASDVFRDDPAMLGFAQDAKHQAAKNKTQIDAGTKREFEAEVPDDGAVLDFDVKTAAGPPAKAG